MHGRARERTETSKHACGGAAGLPDQDWQVWIVFLDERVLGDDELALLSRGVKILVGKGNPCRLTVCPRMPGRIGSTGYESRGVLVRVLLQTRT